MLFPPIFASTPRCSMKYPAHKNGNLQGCRFGPKHPSCQTLEGNSPLDPGLEGTICGVHGFEKRFFGDKSATLLLDQFFRAGEKPEKGILNR